MAKPNDHPEDRRKTRRWPMLVFFLIGILTMWVTVVGLSPSARSTSAQPNEVAKAAFSALLLTFGVACAVLYLRPLPKVTAHPKYAHFYDRPWRRIGAAICLLVSVMFVLGVYLVDIPNHPRTYAAFWIVILMLVLWACVLAVKDVWYTHRLIMRRRSERLSGDALVSSSDFSSKLACHQQAGPPPRDSNH